jgi:peroxiredoxin
MRIASLALLCAALTAPSFAGEVPRPAPDFSMMLPGGKSVSLKSMHGKIVVLAFIYTTCPHCQKLTGDLSAIQREYASRGVEVLESAYNDGVNEKLVLDFIAQYRPSFPVGFDDRASVFTLLQLSFLSTKPVYVPHVLLIDRSGIIRGDYPGEGPFMQKAPENIRAELDRLLKAQPSAAAASHPAAKSKRKTK